MPGVHPYWWVAPPGWPARFTSSTSFIRTSQTSLVLCFMFMTVTYIYALFPSNKKKEKKKKTMLCSW